MRRTIWKPALLNCFALCVFLLSVVGIFATHAEAQVFQPAVDEPAAVDGAEDPATDEPTGNAPAGEELAEAEPVAVEAFEVVEQALAVEELEVEEDLFNGVLQGADPTVAVLTRHVRVNSALARRCCQLSDRQEQRLSDLNQEWIKAEIVKASDSPVKQAAEGIARFFGVGGRVGRNGRAQNRQPHEVVASVRKAIDLEIVDILGKQADKFQVELDARREFRKQSMSDVLVCVLDRRLYLTPEQRDALSKEVNEWLKKELFWQFYFQNEGYAPSIPHSVLARVLDERQLQAIKGVQAWNYEYDQIELQMIGQELQFLIKK